MRRKNISRIYAAALVTSGQLIFASASRAVNYVWQPLASGNASGSWAVSSNWSPVLPAGGAASGDFAIFTNSDITTTSTVTLDANETIGNINFGDTNTATSGGWVLNSDTAHANDSTNTLFLTAAGAYTIITVNQLGAGSVATINANISNGDTGTLALAKGGPGTLVLTGNNANLAGTTAVNDGVLELDFSQPWSPLANILGDSSTAGAAASHLNLQGATLNLKGSLGAVNSQTFTAGLALEIGASNVTFTQNGATSISLNLGSVTRNQSSTLDISLPTSGAVTAALGTSGGAYPASAFGTALGTGGLFTDINGAAFITINNGADWAVLNGTNNVVPASTVPTFYTPSTGTVLTGNADVVGNVNLAASASASSVRFNTALGSTVDNGGDTLSAGGILVTPSSGPVTIQNGILNSTVTAAGDDLVISQNSTHPTTITAVIADATSGATGLTKSGPGTLIVSGSNTYTGTTAIQGGTLQINGGTLGTTLGGDNIQVAPAFGNTATVTVSGGVVSEDRFIIAGNSANFAGGTGIVNQTGGVINSAEWFTIGSFGTGTFNMSGGTLNVNASYADLEVGVFGTAQGTLNLSGAGQINLNNGTNIGMGTVNTTGGGTVNQNGGTITFFSDQATTVGGTGGVIVGAGAPGTFIYNLNAGLLTTNSVTHASGTGTFNFNGGTLQAASNNGAFMANLNAANIGTGGAIIDSNGFNITIPQVLSHASGLTGLDGGLTKKGAGILTISGTSSYTGPTVISGGTLRLPAASTPVPVAVGQYTFDNVTDVTTGQPVTSGVLEPGDVVVNTGSGGAALNATVNIANWGGVGSGVDSGVSIVPGRFGNAAQFDGLGTSIDIPSQIVDQSGNATWTMSAWIQTPEDGAAFVSKNSGGVTWGTGNSVFFLGSNPVSGTPGAFPTAVRFGGGFQQGGTAVDDNVFHMVTFTDVAGLKSVYVDGVLAAATINGFNNTDIATLTRLGFNTDSLSNLDGNVDFFGNLDEVNFFNVALTPQQITQLFTNNVITTGTTNNGQFIPASSAVNISASGASLDLNSNNQTIGSLAGVSGSLVTLGTGNLTAGGNNTSTTFAGSITGTGSVTKAGTGILTITGSNSYSGGTTVSNGGLVVASGTALPNSSSLTIGASSTVGSVTLASGIGATTLSALTIQTGSKLDLTTNKVLINYAVSGIDPVASVAAALSAGYNHGTWTGNGITSSAAALNASKFAVGYLDGNNPADTIAHNVAKNTVVIAYTLAGDAFLEGTVGFDDLVVVAQNFGFTGKDWAGGNFNYDPTGSVGFPDLVNVAQNFGFSSGVSEGSGGGALAAAWQAQASSVPEPASVTLMLGAAASVLGSRRRRPRRA